MDDIAMVIFDMDGLLVDSELYWQEMNEKIFSQFDVELTEKIKHETLGLRLDDIIAIIQTYNADIETQKAREAFDDAARVVYMERSHTMPGARNVVDMLSHERIPMALVSSSPMGWIDMCMNRFRLREYFQQILSTDGLSIPGKPDPAIYIQCIQSFGVAASRVVILEDSIAGVLAAKASGARVVAVPDKRWSVGDFSRADRIVHSLEEVDLPLLSALVS